MNVTSILHEKRTPHPKALSDHNMSGSPGRRRSRSRDKRDRDRLVPQKPPRVVPEPVRSRRAGGGWDKAVSAAPDAVEASGLVLAPDPLKHPGYKPPPFVRKPGMAKVCEPWLVGMCFEQGCPNRHPTSEAEKKEIKEKFATLPCRYGRGCRNVICLFLHNF
eukprot:TRINITY_DN26248_c0_g1_i3.p2 TRINITY_DN26248_c0_g1~~TRINITY_DN26248_c0_g1_i3.p2  ORF type:complete len:162 (+),score=27.55 TRINITY_DN26248_c0_g1_i3:135-620(+)